MAIQEINQRKFDSYNFKSYPNFLATEKYWFADDDQKIIGTVLLDKIDNDWSYVIMILEEDGEYRFSHAEVSMAEGEAIMKVRKRMKEIAQQGKIEENLFSSTLFDPKSTVIITDIDEEIKKFFKKYPEQLYNLNPRKFEELIASIMKDLGFDVELTKATRDGGRDIIAHIKNSVTDFLAFVECKRNSPDNKIGVGLIRKVQGIHYTKKPSQSIIVTTSFFTEPAKEEAKITENQLALKDFNNIKEWLKNY